MTRKKVYHNIKESCYKFETDNIIYVFSSMFYLNNFKKRYEENRKNINYQLSSRYNIEFKAIDYFDIIMYNNIEKRGFYIILKSGGEVECLNNIILNGEIKTLKS